MKERTQGSDRAVDDIAAAFAGLRALFADASAADDRLRRTRTMTEQEREAWMCLQAQAVPGSVAAADVACLLATMDVEYRDNLRRLLRSRTIDWEVDGHEHTSRGPTDRALCCISEHAARLYDQRRDPAVLDWLLDQQPSGGDEHKARNEALIALWDRHWPALLRASSGNPGRCCRVSDALDCALRIAPYASVWRGYLRCLHGCITGRDVDLRSAALTVLRLLRQRHRPVRAGRRRRERVHAENRPGSLS